MDQEIENAMAFRKVGIGVLVQCCVVFYFLHMVGLSIDLSLLLLNLIFCYLSVSHFILVHRAHRQSLHHPKISSLIYQNISTKESEQSFKVDEKVTTYKLLEIPPHCHACCCSLVNGILKGFDKLDNVVLDDCIEYLRGHNILICYFL
jgi:hypothetical protein